MTCNASRGYTGPASQATHVYGQFCWWWWLFYINIYSFIHSFITANSLSGFFSPLRIGREYSNRWTSFTL